MEDSEKAKAEVNGICMYYETEGRGAPLLLLHGFTGSSRDWQHAGREALVRDFRCILPDARGHGKSNNPEGHLTHAQCAEDLLALLDHLEVERVCAIGMSMGGNTLLHLSTLAPERVERMILVSATSYYPEQARQIMRQAAPDAASEQGRAFARYQLEFSDDYDDMRFTPPCLARIPAETLLVTGDRDPLYPLEITTQMYQHLKHAALWVVPGGGHVPIFGHHREAFVRTALSFLKGGPEQLA